MPKPETVHVWNHFYAMTRCVGKVKERTTLKSACRKFGRGVHPCNEEVQVERDGSCDAFDDEFVEGAIREIRRGEPCRQGTTHRGVA